MGRLIPAGTGLPMYRKLGIRIVEDDNTPQIGNNEGDEKISEKILDIPVMN
jgi:hypothetical protein